MKSGFVAVVGRPNVGKSTLVNALVGAKVAITSPRPQTTRNTIRGVLTTAEAQLVFVDTPGLHRPRTALGERLNRLVEGTLAEADAVVFVLDATQRIGPGDRLIAGRLREAGTATVVAVNKVDAAGARRRRGATGGGGGVGLRRPTCRSAPCRRRTWRRWWRNWSGCCPRARPTSPRGWSPTSRRSSSSAS